MISAHITNIAMRWNFRSLVTCRIYIRDRLGIAVPLFIFILAIVHQPPTTYYLLFAAAACFVLELARRRWEKRRKKKWIIKTRKLCGGVRGVPSFKDYDPDLEGCGWIDTPEFRIEGKAHEISQLDSLRRLLIQVEMRFSMRYGTELYKDGILLDTAS